MGNLAPHIHRPICSPIALPGAGSTLSKGGGVLRPANLTANAIGDSYAAASVGSAVNGWVQQAAHGALPWARGMCSQRFYMPGDAIKGVGGNNMLDILNRITDVTTMSIAGPDGVMVKPGIVVFHADAVNDLSSDLATITARFESCVSAILAAGQVCVVVGPTPQGLGTAFTAPQLALLASWRDYLRTRARPALGVLVADPWNDIASSPDGNVATTGMLSDNKHWNPRAAFLVGRRIAAEMAKFAPAARPLPGANLLINPELAGTGGSVSGGITGAVATSWGAATTTLTGDQTVVASKVDNGDGTFKQQFLINGTWAVTSTIGLNQTLSGPTFGVGEIYSLEAGIEVDQISPPPSTLVYAGASFVFKSGGLATDWIMNASELTPGGPLDNLHRVERYVHAADSTRNGANILLTWAAGTYVNLTVRFKLPKIVKHTS